jgi:hypothetical protein
MEISQTGGGVVFMLMNGGNRMADGNATNEFVYFPKSMIFVFIYLYFYLFYLKQ